MDKHFLSNFISVVFFLLDDPPASEFYIPMFQKTVHSIFIGSEGLWRWNRQCVPKRRHIKFRCQGITQKKEYNIQNMVKVWNLEFYFSFHIFHVIRNTEVPA
jgi:hypothetical protein